MYTYTNFSDFDYNFLIEDWEGVKNLISALPSSLKRIVLVSSVGVTKFSELPWR
jgi:hypothetical protein